MKKVTNVAVVIGCENKLQAEKLKEEVTRHMGKKYVIQAPKIKKSKVKIVEVYKKDCECEQDFWEKLMDQNGLRGDNIEGKIVYKSNRANQKGMTIIAEVNCETRDKLLEIGNIRLG